LIRTFYIFWREYWGNLTRRSYLIFTFGFPVFIVVAPLVGGMFLALAIRSALPATDLRPIGVVDQVQLLPDTQASSSRPVEVLFFSSVPAASLALASGEIQAYYHIQTDYWDNGEIVVTYNVAPVEQIDRMFTDWVGSRVRTQVPADILTRLDQGPTISHHGVANESSYAQSDLIQPIVIFLVLYFVRLASAFTASYMFDSIASEANDRTLEIMITSVSPFQIVTGKLFGLLAVGLTQIGMWAAAILTIAILASLAMQVDLLGFVSSWEHVGLLLTVLLGAYLMDQILAAGMGLLRVSGGAGNLLFSTVNSVIGISLIYAAYFVPRNPDSPLAVAASLFPLTSPLVLMIRVAVSEVPNWQIALSVGLLWGTNLLGLFWLRRLLQVNLVANTSSFGLRQWFRKRVVGIRSWVPAGQK
jgi:ABC-2 type transport system permease protein